MIKSLIISAEIKNWSRTYNFIMQYFSNYDISKKDILGMVLSSEEIFSNIVHHAKINDHSKVEICVDYKQGNNLMVMNFKYGGIEFNPSVKRSHDVNMLSGQRNPGGWGLSIIKKFTDSITYRYSNGKNILEISKKAIKF